MIMMIDFWLYGIVKQFIMILNVFIIRYSKIYLHIYIFYNLQHITGTISVNYKKYIQVLSLSTSENYNNITKNV